MTTIRIPSALKFSSTRLTMNGKLRVLPHNCEVEVDEEELHALQNSNVTFEMAGSASNDAQQAEEGAERGTVPSSPDEARASLSRQVLARDEEFNARLAEIEADPATKAEWERLKAELKAEIESAAAANAEKQHLAALDHDKDGKPGGSKKGAASTAAKGAAKKAATPRTKKA